MTRTGVGRGTVRYWHGGVPGLQRGDLLLPATVTATDKAHTVHYATACADPSHMRADRVHLTTDRAAAKAYAASYPDGALYVAEPLGDTEADPDAPNVSIRCERARVVAVYDPCVRWAERGERWLRPLLHAKGGPS